jgi:hypothetical protein
MLLSVLRPSLRSDSWASHKAVLDSSLREVAPSRHAPRQRWQYTHVVEEVCALRAHVYRATVRLSKRCVSRLADPLVVLCALANKAHRF